MINLRSTIIRAEPAEISVISAGLFLRDILRKKVEENEYEKKNNSNLEV